MHELPCWHTRGFCFFFNLKPSTHRLPIFFPRDDLIYLPPPTRTTGVSSSHEPRCTTPPPDPTRSPRRTRPPPPRPLLRARSQPPVIPQTGTVLVTPPPTVPPRPSHIARVTPDSPSQEFASLTINPSPNDFATNQPRSSIQQRSRFTRPPVSPQRNKHMTPIYPFLRETNMLRYFKTEDGVSYRSGQGMCLQISTRFTANNLEYRDQGNTDSDQGGRNVVGSTKPRRHDCHQVQRPHRRPSASAGRRLQNLVLRHCRSAGRHIHILVSRLTPTGVLLILFQGDHSRLHPRHKLFSISWLPIQGRCVSFFPTRVSFRNDSSVALPLTTAPVSQFTIAPPISALNTFLE